MPTSGGNDLLAQISAFIGQTGFPIAVTVWLLYERYRWLGKLSDLMQQLVENEKTEAAILAEIKERIPK